MLFALCRAVLFAIKCGNHGMMHAFEVKFPFLAFLKLYGKNVASLR